MYIYIHIYKLPNKTKIKTFVFVHDIQSFYTYIYRERE